MSKTRKTNTVLFPMTWTLPPPHPRRMFKLQRKMVLGLTYLAYLVPTSKTKKAKIFTIKPSLTTISLSISKTKFKVSPKNEVSSKPRTAKNCKLPISTL